MAGGRAAVVDLDPQGSAMTWSRLRGSGSPAVIAAHPPRLARAVEAARRNGAGLVLIDTAPREAGGAAVAADLADLVLIPCRPATVDLATIPATLPSVADTPTAVVLNACPARGTWTAEAAEAVRAGGTTVLPATLGARVAYARAFTAGKTAQEAEPRSLAAAELENLYRWIKEMTS